MRILLTAFEPFGGRQRNASAEALLRLQQTYRDFDGLQLDTRMLPVETGRAAEMLRHAVDDLRPDIVLCLGEAKREALCLETTGYNERRFRIPDNAGNQFEGTPIIEDAPASYASTLPLDTMMEAVKAVEVPVRLSDDPGRYLCNEALYSLLHHIATNNLAVQAGFLHVPHLPEAAVDETYPSLPTEDVIKGLEAIMNVLSGSAGRQEPQPTYSLNGRKPMTVIPWRVPKSS